MFLTYATVSNHAVATGLDHFSVGLLQVNSYP